MPRLSSIGLCPAVTSLSQCEDGLSQQCGSDGSVTGDVGGLGSDFLDHLGAHVGELVFEFDFLGHGDTVFGDDGSAP